MTTFETIMLCLVIPFVYIMTYIAGKYDILNMVCQMLEEKVKCNHEWGNYEKSNALQLDSMGYPLRLYIRKCSICGASEQVWLDVPEEQAEELKTGESFLLKWDKKT